MPKSNSRPKKLTEARNPESSDATIASVFIEIRSSLLRYVSRYFNCREAIEDVVQEVCVKALEAQKHTNIRHPKAYLYRTSHNIALKELEKCANRLTDCVEDSVLESVLQKVPGAEDQYESRQKFELFCRAVRSLPLKCRRVYILRKVYGFSQLEIAEHMNISVKTVEAHLAKGVVRCTDYMDASVISVAERKQRTKANS